MMTKAKIGAAVLGGYMLGRKKKARLALGLGALLAGAKLKPKDLAGALAGSPLLGSVNDQLRGELLSAGREAANSVLTAKANSLADALHERTLDLREGRGGGEAEDEHEDEQGDRGDKNLDERDERDERARGDGRDEGDGQRDGQKEVAESRAPARKSARRSTTQTARKAAPATRKAADRTRRAKTQTSGSRSSGAASGSRSRRSDDD